MFGQVRGGFWHYRSDERVRRALEESFGWTDAGFPILAPEIQLLYKASSPREKDEVDFKIAVQFLDAGQRAWLLNALRITCPESRWLRVLTGR